MKKILFFALIVMSALSMSSCQVARCALQQSLMYTLTGYSYGGYHVYRTNQQTYVYMDAYGNYRSVSGPFVPTPTPVIQHDVNRAISGGLGRGW